MCRSAGPSAAFSTRGATATAVVLAEAAARQLAAWLVALETAIQPAGCWSRGRRMMRQCARCTAAHCIRATHRRLAHADRRLHGESMRLLVDMRARAPRTRSSFACLASERLVLCFRALRSQATDVERQACANLRTRALLHFMAL